MSFRERLLSYHPDVCAVAGVALVLFGVARIYPPAAWIVAGLISLAVAVRQAQAERRTGNRPRRRSL